MPPEPITQQESTSLFIDTKPSWRSVVLLSLLVLVMYLGCLGIPELRLSDEALNAAFTQEMVSTGKYLTTSLYGHQVPSFPMYSWMASICSGFRFPDSFTFRLPSVLSLIILAVLSGLFARRVQSSYAGFLASAIVLTSFVSFRVGSRAQSEIVNSMLLSSAWYFLYVYGWIKNRWWLAWGVSLFLVLLAVFSVGAKALVIFYAPLFFMWKGLGSQELMEAPSHIFSFAVLLGLLILFSVFLPGQPFMPWNALAFVKPPETFGSYVSHIFTMFPKVVLYLFPWTVFSWTPFCLSMRRFEADKNVCHYLRAIVLTNALMFWLMPGGSPLHLLPTFGPMAVLIGVYFEIVLRRYIVFFSKMLRFYSWIGLVVSLFSIVFWSLVKFNIFSIEGYPVLFTNICLYVSIFVFILFVMLVFHFFDKCSFRSCLLWIIFNVNMLACVNYVLPHSWANQDRRIKGMTLAGHNAENLNMHDWAAGKPPLSTLLKNDGVNTVYLSVPDQQSCTHVLVETFYLRCRIFQIKDPQNELPKDESIVYLLSPHVPAVPSREWTAVSPRVELNTGRKFEYMLQGYNTEWTGHSPVLIIRMIQTVKEARLPFKEIRIYRGVLKKTDAASAEDTL